MGRLSRLVLMSQVFLLQRKVVTMTRFFHPVLLLVYVTAALVYVTAARSHTPPETDSEEVGHTPHKPQGEEKLQDMQQMIQERLKMVQKVKSSAHISKSESDRDREACMQATGDLKLFFQRKQRELSEMEEKQEAAGRTSETLLRDLDEEISELQRRSAELEQLSNTDDPLHLLQSDSLLSKDWSGVSFYSAVALGTVTEFLSRLSEELQVLTYRISYVELKEMQKYAVDVTLDPDTAHPRLTLSEDRKQVTLGDTPQYVPDSPQRFDVCVNVLGKEGFSSGRFYYEVRVGDKSRWDVGVARESVVRKGQVVLSPEDGYWTVILRNGDEYVAKASPDAFLDLGEKPQKVGVFVDYEGGLVSFYDVDNESHMYSFTGQTFTEKLYPFFSPGLRDNGRNPSPLTITPVNQQSARL